MPSGNETLLTGLFPLKLSSIIYLVEAYGAAAAASGKFSFRIFEPKFTKFGTYSYQLSLQTDPFDTFSEQCFRYSPFRCMRNLVCTGLEACLRFCPWRFFLSHGFSSSTVTSCVRIADSYLLIPYNRSTASGLL